MSVEAQPQSVAGRLRACYAAAWLDYRTLRYQPATMGLAALQQLVNVAVWYFIARFLNDVGSTQVQAFGGNYLAYVLLGVLLSQVGTAALQSPFQTIAEAFWEKRLETYRLAVFGIWANVVGRLCWQVLFASLLQSAALLALVLLGAVPLVLGPGLLAALLGCGLLVGAHAGLGLAGASTFFLLEVKNGQDPITWGYGHLATLVSGLYIPLAALPVWLGAISPLIPQTHALALLRATLLGGAGWSAPLVAASLGWLALLTVAALAGGWALLDLALRRAERQGGIGVMV